MITEVVVVPGKTREEINMTPGDELEPVRQVPAEAYLAADAVMDFELDDRDRDPQAPDELWLALRAAAPHIRLAEIDRLLAHAATLSTITEALVYLYEQRNIVQQVIAADAE